MTNTSFEVARGCWQKYLPYNQITPCTVLSAAQIELSSREFVGLTNTHYMSASILSTKSTGLVRLCTDCNLVLSCIVGINGFRQSVYCPSRLSLYSSCRPIFFRCLLGSDLFHYTFNSNSPIFGAFISPNQIVYSSHLKHLAVISFSRSLQTIYQTFTLSL